MTKPEISAIAPLFIVKNVPVAPAFSRDRLGFDITFQGPEPDDLFFGIVQRGAAMIMFKDVGVDPVPNCTRDVKRGIARWDAYLHVPDPDALAAEFSSHHVEFTEPLKDTDDGLRGFELQDTDGYVLFFGRLVRERVRLACDVSERRGNWPDAKIEASGPFIHEASDDLVARSFGSRPTRTETICGRKCCWRRCRRFGRTSCLFRHQSGKGSSTVHPLCCCAM